ncbi:MAG: ATP-binding cassette domain-containing protein [Spirochaetota bacterium]
METAVRFDSVGFYYPKQEIEVVNEEIQAVVRPDEITQVFHNVTADLPAAMMSLVGRNGIGKSTLLLLAGARLFPHEGTITLFGTDTKRFVDAAVDPELEEERNRYVSFVYQNMEFESEAPVGDLMEFVYENGYYEERDETLVQEITKTFELEGFLHLKTQQLAKGQLQRAIVAFSLLYGSKMIMMDEPVFALEERQKDRVFAFLLEFSRSRSTPIYYSAHNLELTQKYSDYMLLFSTNGDFKIGPTEKLFSRDEIEAAYQAPIDSLYRRDNLYREVLIRSNAPDEPTL